MVGRQPTPAEVCNDHSLAFCAYRQWELVYSDVHRAVVRFCRYEPCGNVRVATVNGIAELPELVPPLNVRRPSSTNDQATREYE